VIRQLSLAFALFVLVVFGRLRMLAVESHPSIEVYLPPPDKATGAGVVVVPAGVEGRARVQHGTALELDVRPHLAAAPGGLAPRQWDTRRSAVGPHCSAANGPTEVGPYCGRRRVTYFPGRGTGWH
jgi:hypothetical protein